MAQCDCKAFHSHRRVVLTGGPGAGKTAVLELVRRFFCRHVKVLPESATILFSGGFPRGGSEAARMAAQRAIFRVQLELEQLAAAEDDTAIVLCDRGTLDGMAYWPRESGEELLDAMGSSRGQQLARYDAVIHMRTPELTGYNHSNPLRLESLAEAHAIDQRIAQAWSGHPQRHFVPSTSDFLDKARHAIHHIREQLPECCRRCTPPIDLG